MLPRFYVQHFKFGGYTDFRDDNVFRDRCAQNVSHCDNGNNNPVVYHTTKFGGENWPWWDPLTTRRNSALLLERNTF